MVRHCALCHSCSMAMAGKDVLSPLPSAPSHIGKTSSALTMGNDSLVSNEHVKPRIYVS